MAAAYPASKAAVIAIRGDRQGRRLLGVSSLHRPAVIETPILTGLSQHHIDYMVERIPLGGLTRWRARCFLASEDLVLDRGDLRHLRRARDVLMLHFRYLTPEGTSMAPRTRRRSSPPSRSRVGRPA